MDRRVIGAQQRIENLYAKSLAVGDQELQADIARHLCVLTSGLIEQWIISALDQYSQGHSVPSVARYAGHYISRLQNAKFEDVVVLLARFDPEWRDHFERTTPEETKDAINSIVNNRNQIAHGQQVGVSIISYGNYYRHVKEFLVSLESFIATV